jgi:hypothetical protein
MIPFVSKRKRIYRKEIFSDKGLIFVFIRNFYYSKGIDFSFEYRTIQGRTGKGESLNSRNWFENSRSYLMICCRGESWAMLERVTQLTRTL